MGHAELQELLGAYALDAVEPDEAVAIERHLPTCPRCRNELAEHREVAALLGYAGGTAPSGLWDRIIASLEEPPPALRLTRMPDTADIADAADTHPIPGAPPVQAAPGTPGARLATWGPPVDQPEMDPQASAPDNPTEFGAAAPGGPYPGGDSGAWAVPSPQPTPGWTPPPAYQSERPVEADKVVPIGRAAKRRHERQTVEMRLMLALATAAAVIVAALGVQVGRLEMRKPRSPATPNLLALAYRVADADPKARHLTLTSADGVHTVKAVIIPDGTTFLGSGNLATLPKDETYQMWGVVDGARVSLGVIGNNPTYAAFTTPPVANVLAMTVEPRGGVVSSTKTPIIAGVVPSA